MLSSQISVGVLFIVQLRQAARPDLLALSPPDTARKAATLAVAGMAMIFLILLIKAWALGTANSTWLLPGDNG
jgi:NAD/NADP transhydrogenase beta subunit